MCIVGWNKNQNRFYFVHEHTGTKLLTSRNSSPLHPMGLGKDHIHSTGHRCKPTRSLVEQHYPIVLAGQITDKNGKWIMMCITCCCEAGFDRSTYQVSALHDIKADLHKSAALQNHLLRWSFCSEAPQQTTRQNPWLQGAGEALISLEQHLSPRRRRRLNWTR